MAITLKQVAAEAGLSNQTVSFVLGSKAHLFRPETQQRVLEAADRLGYRPNVAARSMRNGRFDAIAILMSSEGQGRSTLFTGFLHGVEMTARENGLHLIVTALPDRQLTDPQFAPKMLRESMADGLLINYYREIPDQMEDLIVRYRVPSIWTNARREADCAYPDDFGASRRATQRLIQRGHRRIAYVDCTHDHPLDPRRDHYSAFDRHAGYLAAMQEAALPASTFLPGRKLQGSAVSLALRDWLSLVDRPSAVVTYCSVDVLGLLQVAPSLGVKVPEDLTLVTHEEPESLYGVAPVTTMLIPARELGRIAVEMLKDKIAEPARKLPPRAVEFGVQEAEG